MNASAVRFRARSRRFAAGDLKAALVAAQSNGTDDRFFLAPGVYSADAFAYASPERVQIAGAGAGAGKTILRGNLAGGVAVTLEGDPASSVSGLTVQALGDVRVALYLMGARAHGVAVDATGTAGQLVAGVVLRDDAAFERGRVDIGASDQQPSRCSPRAR